MAQKTLDEYAADVADLMETMDDVMDQPRSSQVPELRVVAYGLRALYAELTRTEAERAKARRRRERRAGRGAVPDGFTPLWGTDGEA